MTKVDGEIDGFTFNCMGWNASTQVIIIIIIITSFKIIIFLINTNLLSPVNLFSFKATWIGEYLGPTLEVNKLIFSFNLVRNSLFLFHRNNIQPCLKYPNMDFS